MGATEARCYFLADDDVCSAWVGLLPGMAARPRVRPLLAVLATLACRCVARSRIMEAPECAVHVTRTLVGMSCVARIYHVHGAGSVLSGDVRLSSVVPHQWWPVDGVCRRRFESHVNRHVTCRGPAARRTANETLSFSVAYACGHFALVFIIHDISFRMTISVAEFNTESTEITLHVS